MNRKGIEFSFAWIFAIIVGSAIIFLAIYVSTNIVTNTRYQTDTETAAQLDVLFNPIETNLESGKLVQIDFPDITRMYNDCSDDGNFGKQSVRTSTRSGVGSTWQTPGAPISSNNRYIFSEGIVEGKTAYAFTKPVDLPYKVGDMIIIYSQEYCFVNPTDDVKDEISLLNLPKASINSSVRYCPRESKKVCFFSNENGCDIKVDSNSVTQNGKKVYYQGDFIYGAIFSEQNIYECQVKRLIKRDSALSELYASKSDFLSLKGCTSNLAGELTSFKGSLDSYESSSQLKTLFTIAKEVENKNNALNCKLF